jgi:hypothetical protein
MIRSASSVRADAHAERAPLYRARRVGLRGEDLSIDVLQWSVLRDKLAQRSEVPSIDAHPKKFEFSFSEATPRLSTFRQATSYHPLDFAALQGKAVGRGETALIGTMHILERPDERYS